MIRVLVVDDQSLVRAGLRMLCDSADDMEVVGEAGNGHEAVRHAAALLPDVILMDLRMPGLDGIGATERILAARPGTRIVVLTTFDDDDHLYPALSAGAIGFLAKDVAPVELLTAVRRAASGEAAFSTPVLKRLVDRALTTSAVPVSALPGSITDRERDVLALVGAGYSNSEIATALHLGITTVKTHIGNLMAKTEALNRVRLALIAIRAGITP